jgi:tetrahydromethanopterin S-methyltransferase subunit G
MKALLEAVENWIDERILVSSKVLVFETKFKEMSDRIAELEGKENEDNSERLDELNERIETLESEMYEVERATEDIPDTYSIEVMIDDVIETKVMDAVKEELDSTEFKVTIER